MNFNILLALSVIVCLIGVVFRFSVWFTQGFQPSSPTLSAGQRFGSGVKGLFGTLFSPRLGKIISSFFMDLLLQKRILDKSLLRWTTHTLIFFGFMLLFFMHALGTAINSNYVSTQNPYLVLRNIFGLMVLAGLALAIYRRVSFRSLRLKSALSDWAAIIIIAAIIISGILLEGAKMSSYTTYQRMVEEYGTAGDDNEALALEAYWVSENGLRSPNITSAPGSEMIALGREINGNSCIECHASNKSAFLSFALAGATKPFAAALGDGGAVTMFWYFHILSCFGFLAWLPFSKMFHIISAPFSLMTKRATDDVFADPANVLNRQMMGLSACTHCGSCSVECSASMFYESFSNDFILPSEKVQYLKKIAAGKEQNPQVLKQMQEGLYVCTSCDRCTMICPSGINLKELFVSARYSLLAGGQPEVTMLSHFSFPLALAQNFVDDHRQALRQVTDIFKQSFKHLTDLAGPLTLGRDKNFINNSYKSCYTCQRCTNVCPVVRSYENPSETLGLLPHQIMYTLGLGDTDMAMGAQMIWSCSTCYLCQEHCPNQVELCDIFYSLKNRALNTIEAGGEA
jgi:heterodisulfide reductase subunit C/nitrate reductase gamma subunit